MIKDQPASLNHHDEKSPTCGFCSQKLLTAHPYLKTFFDDLKKQFPMVHVSWAFRDKDMQELFFKQGKSRCHWPDSAHNKTDKDGNPKSWAIDLFTISIEGIAMFRPEFYKMVAKYVDDKGYKIKCGAYSKGLVDDDHFQLIMDE